MICPVYCLHSKESLIMLLIDQDRAGDCDNIRKFPPPPPPVSVSEDYNDVIAGQSLEMLMDGFRPHLSNLTSNLFLFTSRS